MADNLKPLLKRIDDISAPVFELDGQKGVNVKHLEKGYNKDVLAKLAFALFSCLQDAKKLLEDQNKRIEKASRAIDEQQKKFDELDANLVKGSSKDDLMKDILFEVKENGRAIADINTNLEEKSERIVSEANKVSSYAEILKKSAGKSMNEINTVETRKFAKCVMVEMKATERRKNLVFYGCPIYDDKEKIEEK